MAWIRSISETPTKKIQPGIIFTLNVKATKESVNHKSEIEYSNSIMFWNGSFKVYNVLKWTLQSNYRFNM